MLASINVLRAHSNSPPPLEPIDETIAIETRPPRLTPDEEFFGLERDFGGSESSDDSMPDLRSVSNSSDSDCDESDEDVEEIHGINGGTSFHPHDLRFDIAGSLRAEEATARRGGRSSLSILNRGLSPATQRTVAQDGDTGRFSTVVGSEEQRDVNTDIEDDEGSSNEEVAATIAVPPTTLSMPDPPFVTDGRGRVVWTSPGENVRNDESNELIVPPGQRATVASANGEFNGDVRGRVIETSSEGQASEETAVDVRDMDRPRRSLLGRIIDAFF
jgi:E3 ubiquitin-protein ligase makorin